MRTMRRSVCLLSALLALAPQAMAQARPMGLRLVRRRGWEELMGRNQCVISDLYLADASFPVSDLGSKLCNALELAYRNNLSEISSIPPGGYAGFVRTDGPRGWRIELTGTGARSHIQLHVGNRPADTIGCILPGTGNSTDLACQIAGSKEALKELEGILGSTAGTRVAFLVQE